MSTLFDVDTLVPHDVVVAPFATSEREEFVGLFDRVQRGDIVVLDRGYPSFEILRILVDAGIHFVLRVPTSHTFAAVEQFLRGSCDDGRLTLAPPVGHALAAAGPVDVRIIRAPVAEGAPWMLLTSLDEAAAKVVARYRQRWEIEEYYKLTKGDYLGQGQLHARSAEGVRQEIYAHALYIALTRYLMAAAAPPAARASTPLAQKSAMLAVAAHLTRLLIGADDGSSARHLVQLLARIGARHAPHRSGRSCPRRSYLPTRKWGPQGRRGG